MFPAALKVIVNNRGVAPDSFLAEQLAWGRPAPADIFAPRPNPDAPGPDPDIYAHLATILGPWKSLLHRRAVMLELQRVHAGFESSWKFNEGVDVTNQTSMLHREGQETGIFQVSFDSTYLAHAAMKPFAVQRGIGTVGSFIPQMKADHQLAFEYYARLVRFNYQWAGPLKRHEVDAWLSPSAVAAYETLLA